MKLSRLEIVGFKSFADKVTLNFSDGITGVVGPNGCGKSNIVDAIRWVMGEQSAKHLRGRAMEDVIFSGSDSRGPMGLSEVTLTLKNDGVVPSEYAQYEEIAVRRRLFRDGQSEYSINKTPVRLKDITDLFLGTGVGTRAYSMIEQGRIGFIVNSKPEERRFLIEEVAGITKYKARKKTAQRRMEATEQNLLRVNDIVTELGRQLGSLERQAKKAERYKQVKAELCDLELCFSVQRFLELRGAMAFSSSQAERVQQDEDDAANSLATVDTSLETARLTLADTESDNARLGEQVYGVDARLKVLERDLEFFDKERENYKERGSQAAEEALALETQRATIEQEIAVLSEHAESLGGETESAMAALEEKSARLSELQRQRRALEAQAEALQRAMIDALTVLANERAHVQSDDHRRIEISARRERYEGELAELEKQIAEHGAGQTATAAEVERLTALVADLRDRRLGLDEQVARGKQAAATAAAKLLSSKEQATERKSRLSSLLEIERKYEGYQAGVRAVMTGRDKDSHGVVGLVADVIAAKSEYEGALEAVLGARLQDVIVQSQSHGKDTVEYLREKAEGRATFIPLDLCEPKQPASPLPEAARGRLRDLVSVKPSYEKIADYLLGNVALVDSLDTARALCAAGLDGWTCVTRTGDVLDAFGVLSGGATTGASEGLLKQKREIKELEQEVHALDTAVLLADAEKNQANGALLSSEEQLQATLHELHDCDIKKAKVEKDLAAAVDVERRLLQRKAQLDGEIGGLRTQEAELDVASAERVARMAAAQADHATKERELALLGDRDATLREEEAQAQEELTALKVSFAQRDEKQKNVLRTLERLRQSLQETDERIERAKSTVETGSSQVEVLADKIVRGKEERVSLLDALERGKAELQAGRLSHERLAQEVRASEERAKTLARQVGDLREERSAFEMKVREATMHMQHVQRSIAEQYDTDLLLLVHDFHMRDTLDEGAGERISQLKVQLSRMGDINLTAIAEFQEVRTRYEFLTTQKADLEMALTQLRSAILKINRTSRDRFVEAFNATNTMFQKVFPRLFRGGEARLELTMEGTDDVLESGIEIISQPPGKKLQSVQLLSGGEKALTAVSLVFSIFLIKPSPFCVLDEVDAPLDEANVMRFNELLREISQVSQFVVITHSKKTMECADRLYGITMEEPGISKTVSVDLTREHGRAGAAASA